MDLEWFLVMARGIIAIVIPNIPKILDFGKKSLDTGKSAMDLYETAKNIADKDATEHPEQAVDRVHALADATRSLAPIAFAEVLFYAVKVTAVLILFRWFANGITYRDAKRIARKMREEEQTSNRS